MSMLRVPAACRLFGLFLLALSAGCSSTTAPPAATALPSASPAATVTPAASATPTARAEDWPEVAAPPLAAPQPVSFPADEGPHAAQTEWWYYNGHLQADNGGRYGFEVVVFKRQAANGRAGLAAHVAVTDHQRRLFQFSEDIAVPPPLEATPGSYSFALGNASIAGEDGTASLRATTAAYSLDLRLSSAKPPVLHGSSGFIGVAEGEQSYYYSRTRMEVRGSLVDNGPSAVTGIAWMDHQWGDFSLQGEGGWDWFSMQLEDGSDIMLTVLRDGRGNILLAYGTLVGLDGTAEHIGSDRFRVKATGSWTSDATHITYPMGWEFAFPERGLTARLDPVLEGQELNTAASVNTVYWEGEVTIAGSSAAGPVTGMGYVELTGYRSGGDR